LFSFGLSFFDLRELLEAFQFGFDLFTGLFGGAHGVVFPQVSLDAEEAAKEPFVADEAIDLEALLGVARFVGPDEFLAGFAEDELRCGIEAGFEGILRGGALAFLGARSGSVAHGGG
jgi:hypothetical protein